MAAIVHSRQFLAVVNVLSIAHYKLCLLNMLAYNLMQRQHMYTLLSMSVFMAEVI